MKKCNYPFMDYIEKGAGLRLKDIPICKKIRRFFSKKTKRITTPNYKSLGKLVICATGLRKMANAIQKKYKTKGDVLIDTYISKWTEKGKTKYTLGMIIK